MLTPVVHQYPTCVLKYDYSCRRNSKHIWIYKGTCHIIANILRKSRFITVQYTYGHIYINTTIL